MGFSEQRRGIAQRAGVHFLEDSQDYTTIVDRGAAEDIYAVEEVSVRDQVVASFENLMRCRPFGQGSD